MSHNGVGIVDFLLLAALPAAGLLAVEAASRALRAPKWAKLAAQAAVSAGFGVAYVTLVTEHWLTTAVLLLLSVALLYQARRAWSGAGDVPY